MRHAPLLNAFLFFVAGIVSTFYFHLSFVAVSVATTVALAVLAALTFVRPLHNVSHSFFSIALALYFFGMGVVMVQLHDPLANKRHYVHHTEIETTYRLQVRLLETPVERAHSYRVPAEVKQIGNTDTCVAVQGKIMLYLPKDSVSCSLCYGDVLAARGRLTLPSGVDNPYQFDYRTYLRRKGIARQCRIAEGDYRQIGHETGGLIAASKRLQRHLIERLQDSPLEPSQRGIAEALLLGWRGDLEEETQSRFRDAGIIHLLCVSGLHVGIIAALIGFVCQPLLHRRKWVTHALQLCSIWMFVLITGMAPATLRAGIMFSFFVVAQILERNNNSYNTLSAAALLMLCIQPTLVVDIGFQLSFTAVLGIVIFYQPLCRLIPPPITKQIKHTTKRKRDGWMQIGRHILYRIWQLACLSTAAQLGTLPISLYHFNQFPTYFLIANITIVPAAGLLVGTTLLLVLTATLPTATQVVGWVLRQELDAVDALTRWIQQLPGALLDHIYCDGWVVTLLVAATAALALLLHSRKKRWTPIPLFCLLALIGYWLYIEKSVDTQQRWIVYNMPYHTAIEFFNGHNSVLLVDETIYNDSTRMNYVSDNLLTHLRIHHRIMLPINVNIESSFLQVHNDTIRFHDRLIEIDNCPTGLMEQCN